MESQVSKTAKPGAPAGRYTTILFSGKAIIMGDQRTRGAFCHIVIPARDLAKAKSFYEAIFGWQVQMNVPGPGYWFFESGNVGGAFSSNKKPAEETTVLMISVDDMRATLDLISQQGGIVTQDRSRIGDAAEGYDAYFRDPNGNEMGLYSDR